MTATADATAALDALHARPDLAAALAWYDTLDPLSVDDLLGSWRGSGVPTGHPMDGLLERFGWYGKRFAGPDDVHPLVFDRGGDLYTVNPSRLPVGLAVRAPWVGRLPGVPTVMRAAAPLLRTHRPQARLRMTEFRGVVTATMVYDRLPIHDVFRRVDGTRVLGVMDLRGAPPFVFLLERER